jgi:hypothetical protein
VQQTRGANSGFFLEDHDQNARFAAYVVSGQAKLDGPVDDCLTFEILSK